ncbi:MAG: nucleotide exchange factor GrpE [Desulfuromonadales bacterium]|nr:nucleotide exchange factor GrpE [Desulfuromonadales bacterium]
MSKKKTQQNQADTSAEHQGNDMDGEITAGEIKEPAENTPPTLEEQLAASRSEAEENRDQYLRACAELENFRKRAQREKEDICRFANEKILREMLPVIDNLGRAIEHADGEAADSKGLIEGIQLTLDQFAKVLDQFGVKEIAALGAPFDPAFHEAMGQIESAEHPVNSVAQVFQKGYLLNERLLRPALVMVAKAPAAHEPKSTDTE